MLTLFEMTNISKINNLTELRKTLDSQINKEKYSEIINRINFKVKEIDPLCFWDPDGYSRINIERNKNYELTLMCWEQGQQTPIHNHNSQEGWIYVIDGELTEEVYYKGNGSQKLEKKHTNILKPKDTSYINDSIGVHRIINSNKGRSISIHLHINELGLVNIYNENTGEISKKDIHNC